MIVVPEWKDSEERLVKWTQACETYISPAFIFLEPIDLQIICFVLPLSSRTGAAKWPWYMKAYAGTDAE